MSVNRRPYAAVSRERNVPPFVHDFTIGRRTLNAVKQECSLMFNSRSVSRSMIPSGARLAQLTDLALTPPHPLAEYAKT